MPVTVYKFNSLHRDIAIGSIDLDDASAGAFKCMLLGNSYSVDLTDQKVSDLVAHEIASANGYTAGGATLANVTLTLLGAVATFDADDISWTATGGPISAAFAAIYYNTGAGSNAQRELLTLIDFGGLQAAGDGTDFRIVWPVSGILQIQ